MARPTAIEKAIAKLQEEIDFRQHAINALRAQLATAKPEKARKPRAVKKAEDVA